MSLTGLLAVTRLQVDRHELAPQLLAQSEQHGMRHIVTVWRTAFPDLQYEIQEEIVHDDKVVTRVLMRGTHLGEFQQGVGPGRIMGTMAPTGR